MLVKIRCLCTKLFHDFSWPEHKLRDRFFDLSGDHALITRKYNKIIKNMKIKYTSGDISVTSAKCVRSVPSRVVIPFKVKGNFRLFMKIYTKEYPYCLLSYEGGTGSLIPHLTIDLFWDEACSFLFLSCLLEIGAS